MPSRPRGDGKAAAGEGGASPRGSKQTGMNPNDKEADLDFNTFNLGNGPLTEKKKRLAAYVQNIMADKKNVKNCNETIRRILDHRQMKNFENKEESLALE